MLRRINLVSRVIPPPIREYANTHIHLLTVENLPLSQIELNNSWELVIHLLQLVTLFNSFSYCNLEGISIQEYSQELFYFRIN